jgi:iron complex outermembrane receptor protein
MISGFYIFATLFQIILKPMRLIFTLLMALTLQSLHAQKRLGESFYLSGVVTDSLTGTPLVHASIYIPDARTGTMSDEKGYFKTTALAAGRYLVEVSYSGYQNIVRYIDINNNNTVQNFRMQIAITEQEGVTITGVSSATRLKLSPQQVSIIKRDDLIKSNATNIINSIGNIAGVTAVTTGPAISKPFIRGLGYNRVVTVNDGIRQEGQQWGDEHGIEIDDYSAQRVEVLKGPASLMYGSDALAGVINILSMTPATEGYIKFNAASEYQFNDRLRGAYGNIAGTKNGFSFNAYGSYKAAADYKNKYDGYVFNSKFLNRNVGAMIGYAGTWGHSYLSATNFDQLAGLVEGDRDSVTGAFIKALPGSTEAIATSGDFSSIHPLVPYQHIQHFKLISDNSFNTGIGKAYILIGYQRNQRKEMGNPDEPNTPVAYFDLKTVNYSAKFNFNQKPKWKTSIGVSGMIQQNSHHAEEVLIPDYDLVDAGAFLFTQYHEGRFSFSGGIRFDNRNINGKNTREGADLKFIAFSKSFSNISGSAGISYEATSHLTLKLNIARGFRAPNLAELASNGAHEGTNRWEIGNINLNSEKSLQADLGVALSSDHVTMNAAVYYNHISNFIFYRKVLNHSGGDSVLIDAGSGATFNVFRFEENTANLYGAEFNIDLHPHPLDWLHIENTFSYTRARFNSTIDNTRNVPLIPAARYLAEIKGEFFKKGKTLRDLFISIETDYRFKQNNPFTGYNTETSTGDYLLLNATIGANIMAKGKKIASVYIIGTNLADIAYQDHLSRLKYTAVNEATGRQGVFNTGRNIGIKLNVPLEFSWK